MHARDVHEREGEPKNWSRHIKQHKRDLDYTNMIQMNQVFTKTSKKEVT